MSGERLAVCALFENAERLLPEWLAYHQLVGVGHFVLYDNGSTDASAEVIRSSPAAGQVTLIRWPQKPGRLPAYRHFLDIFAPGFAWAAFIDVDQFLVPRASRNVMDTLGWLRRAAGIVVQRRVFAPGAWPGGILAMEAFQRRAADPCPVNARGQIIVRCSELVDVGPEAQDFRINGAVCNTAGQEVANRLVQDLPCFENLVVHQYCIEPDPRALAGMMPAVPGQPTPAAEQVIAVLSEQADDAMTAFAPAVRQLLGVAAAPAPDQAPHAAPQSVSAPSPGMGAPSAPAADPAPAPSADPASAPAGQEPGLSTPVAGSAAPATREHEIAPGWTAAPPDGQVRTGGLALVFRDRSRPGEHWLAALRGAVADAIDPDFLVDEYDRIMDFPTSEAARAACDAALTDSK